MTKREMFVAIMNVTEVAENAEMVEFLNHQIELLDSRNTNRKPSKTQVENEYIKEAILLVLGTASAPMRVKDMIATDTLSEYSSSKITALLRQLLPETGTGQVIKTIEKKVSYFSLA